MEKMPPTPPLSPKPEEDSVQSQANLTSSDLVGAPPTIPPEQILIEWQAASRPFKKRTRQYYTTLGIFVFLISLILFFAGQFLPIAVVLAVGFLSYILSSVPPELIANQITNYGIRNENTLYYWDEVTSFWLDDKLNSRLLNIETVRFPGRITLIIDPEQEKELTNLLSEVLPLQKPIETLYDRAAKWLQEKIPLENS